jgi:hypothetical protein
VQVSTIEKQSAITSSLRRYDVDWLRVLALGLLIIYHAVLGFQPWARWIFFIQNDQPLDGLWVVMSIINVWRIPILFLISGMGVRFAMERRDWKQLLKDRTIRILVPFVFGYFFICTISVYVALAFYGLEISYVPNAGHLWFLANIFSYVVLLLPLLVYLKNRPDHGAIRFLRKICRWRFGLFLFALPLMAEAWLLNPATFEAYAMTPYGFGLGMVCFFTGFLFILLKEDFWQAIARVRWLALGLAVGLYLVRLLVFELAAAPHWLIAFESMSWMLAILGHGSVYLNKSSTSLAYFSNAVYPVYILHMPVQFCLSYFLFPLSLPAIVKLIILLAATFGASLLIYEFVIRRLKWIRPMFGMKLGGN